VSGETAAASVRVARRRPVPRTGSAALLVVLAGPVTPGARWVRRGVSPRLLGAWARVLRPGGLLAVLAPPTIGRSAHRGGHTSGDLVRAAQDVGLTYTQHVVLVHTPAIDGRLAAPVATRRPHAPFLPVHTDLWLLTHYPADPAHYSDSDSDSDPVSGPFGAPSVLKESA
jgi:hypothetical protein